MITPYFRSAARGGYHISKVYMIEEKYKAKFLGFFSVPNAAGTDWSDMPVDVFYQPNPDKGRGHSNYFGAHVDALTRLTEDPRVFITNAEGCFKVPMDGIIADSGEVIMSHYVHDNHFSMDGSVWIDGGRYYTRSGVYEKNRYVKVRVIDGEFYMSPNA